MGNYSHQVKSKMIGIIKEMEATPWLYARNPEKDFLRNRKLSFQTIIKILLSIGGSNINKELMNYFNFSPNTATASAFVQQRQKLLPQAMEYLFNGFTNSFYYPKTFKGYRLLAIDSTALNIPHNPEDKNTYILSNKKGKGFNLMHLTALYDLCNNVYNRCPYSGCI